MRLWHVTQAIYRGDWLYILLLQKYLVAACSSPCHVDCYVGPGKGLSQSLLLLLVGDIHLCPFVPFQNTGQVTQWYSAHTGQRME